MEFHLALPEIQVNRTFGSNTTPKAQRDDSSTTKGEALRLQLAILLTIRYILPHEIAFDIKLPPPSLLSQNMQQEIFHNQMISETIAFVKNTLVNAEAGHDWWHTYRVWNNAKHIAKQEKADVQIVELAALLHDIADAKFNNGDENIGPSMALNFLNEQGVDIITIEHVVNIIRYMSFKNSFDGNTWTSPEMEVLQDADRLDAIGAIGIARAFSYGGFKGRTFYDPAIPPNLNMDKETYKKSSAPTINHFYEKILLLKGKMNTATGKKLAEERHRFMETYLEQFYKEWEGKV